jgi:hypothetical protein
MHYISRMEFSAIRHGRCPIILILLFPFVVRLINLKEPPMVVLYISASHSCFALLNGGFDCAHTFKGHPISLTSVLLSVWRHHIPLWRVSNVKARTGLLAPAWLCAHLGNEQLHPFQSASELYRLIDRQILRMQRVPRGQRRFLRTSVSVFSNGAATCFLFKQLLNYPLDAEQTPFQNNYASQNRVAPEIELGTSVGSYKSHSA